MHWLVANSDRLCRSPAYRVLYLLFRKHSFPSRLHQEPTVHRSVPKPTDPASFKAARGFPSYSQALQPVHPPGPPARATASWPPLEEPTIEHPAPLRPLVGLVYVGQEGRLERVQFRIQVVQVVESDRLGGGRQDR